MREKRLLPHRCWPGLPTSATLRLCRVQCRWGRAEVEAPIARRGDSIIGRCVSADGKYSLTEYAVLAAGPGHSLLACWPRTGRTHQIRVHMSYIGHPLAGIRCTAGRTSFCDVTHCTAASLRLRTR